MPPTPCRCSLSRVRREFDSRPSVGSEYSLCTYGNDCDDCGARSAGTSTLLGLVLAALGGVLLAIVWCAARSRRAKAKPPRATVGGAGGASMAAAAPPPAVAAQQEL